MKRLVISGIYKITNIANNNVYVGQSIDILRRWNDERRGLKYEKYSNKVNRHLLDDYKKYGGKNFKFQIIEKTINDINIINKQETYWENHYINLLGRENVYNVGHTGKGSTMSEEQKEKISESKKEFYKNHPEELEFLRQNVLGPKNPMYGKKGKLAPFYGHHHTEENKEKSRMRQIGKKMPEHVRELLHKINAERYKDPKEREKSRQYALNFHKEHPEWKQQQSERNKIRYSDPKEREKQGLILKNGRWMNKDGKYSLVREKNIQLYLKNGWVFGHDDKCFGEKFRKMRSELSKGRIWVNNEKEEYLIYPKDLEKYEKTGFKRGMSKYHKSLCKNKKYL